MSQEWIEIPEENDPFKLPADATDERKAKCYFNAGVLSDSSKAKFSDGSILTEKECYVKSIELKPDFADPYGNLATCLEKGETVEFNGMTWNEQALYIRAIELSPTDALFYTNLAGSITPADRVQLSDGSTWDNRLLLLKSVELDDKNPDALHALGKTFSVDNLQQMKFADGRIWSEKDLYVMCLDLDSQYHWVYVDLADKLMTKDEKVVLKDGTEFVAIELYKKGIEADSDIARGYLGLTRFMEPNEEITLSEGCTQTREEILAKAQELDPALFQVPGGEEGGA